jgi:hypothetical protein
MRTVVLVPRRSDGGRRDVLWTWLAQRWKQDRPDWEVFEGHHNDGLFNRSAAINTAARAAGQWDVAVIADADSLAGADQLQQAVDLAATSGTMVIAYTRYVYLNRTMSDLILAGFTGSWWDGVEFTLANTCSTMVAVPRKLWNAVGGFDEGFVGWGWEDCAFSASCAALGGRTRIPGEVWHLWHPPSGENNQDSPEWQAGLARLNRYSACEEDPKKTRALLVELGLKKKPGRPPKTAG